MKLNIPNDFIRRFGFEISDREISLLEINEEFQSELLKIFLGNNRSQDEFIELLEEGYGILYSVGEDELFK